MSKIGIWDGFLVGNMDDKLLFLQVKEKEEEEEEEGNWEVKCCHRNANDPKQRNNICLIENNENQDIASDVFGIKQDKNKFVYKTLVARCIVYAAIIS